MDHCSSSCLEFFSKHLFHVKTHGAVQKPKATQAIVSADRQRAAADDKKVSNFTRPLSAFVESNTTTMSNFCYCKKQQFVAGEAERGCDLEVVRCMTVMTVV